ncbi:MlaD family protein [Mycobacterium sp. CVI_P3]|uniref:MlaD family protein n=1 Tax=Mycobacterium pinniadriaticum TaxID=2994102 RepID=A0ABT3SC62_9MYCO|nr:MlaD family protein [Mycobacterium pinniadriaticum]MCX2930692.1 MlaD family protein [Mycobacterium pinniadriaticum]MCX2937116.1 MlaD family protein [Mycobacterium pinniadriaticum]
MIRVARVLAVCVCVGVLSSCSAITVADLPQPGNSYRDGYPITMEFANVLNLPDRAKVVMDGTTIGIVDNIKLGQRSVDVTAQIDKDVRIPADTHAVLQQATVLGDIYVAITGPDQPGTAHNGPGATLPSGGRIALARTTSPPQLEDTIANLANFVSSGSIQRIQNSIIRVNNVTPERSEQVRAIASRVTADLRDLSDNIDTVDQWLSGVAGTGQVLAGHVPKFRYWFSPEGMIEWERMSVVGAANGILIPSVGSIYTGGYWMVPMLESMGVAVGAVQRSKWAVEGEYRPWRDLFQEAFLPEDKYPAMNIVSVQTADGRDITNNVQDVLRMLGAIP